MTSHASIRNVNAVPPKEPLRTVCRGILEEPGVPTSLLPMVLMIAPLISRMSPTKVKIKPFIKISIFLKTCLGFYLSTISAPVRASTNHDNRNCQVEAVVRFDFYSNIPVIFIELIGVEGC